MFQSTWLNEGERNEIPTEHRTRLEEAVRSNRPLQFRDQIFKNDNVWIIDYAVHNTWFQLLNTHDEPTFERVSAQVERFMRYLKAVVYPNYKPDPYAGGYWE